MDRQESIRARQRREENKAKGERGKRQEVMKRKETGTEKATMMGKLETEGDKHSDAERTG